MPSYLVLGHWTEQGIRQVKNGPQRLDAAKQAARDVGGKLVFFYLTMGEYDFATLLELPNDEVAARVLLTLGTQGNVRTATLKAFTEDEYRRIVSALP